MPITSAPIVAIGSPQAAVAVAPRVMIDWADMVLDDAGAALEGLLSWVQSSPAPSSVHVVLPPVHRSPAARRLQNCLQSLGCTVTLRWPASDAAHRTLGRRYTA